MKDSIRRFLLVGILIATVSGAWSQTIRQRPPLPGERRDRWAWATEEWTGNNRPYQQIRSNLDKAFAKKQVSDTLLQRYEKAAVQDPFDPEAQFRWIYAAFNLALRRQTDRTQIRVTGAVSNALSRPASPRVYEYARLKFLAEATNFPYANLKVVGRRLVKRNPSDYDVKYVLVTILDPSSSAASTEKNEALSYAQDLFRLDFKRSTPSVYAAIGAIYSRAWLRTKSPDDAAKGIAAYRKFLQLAPANDSFRKSAEGMIREMQRGR